MLDRQRVTSTPAACISSQVWPDVLANLTGLVESLMSAHEAKRSLWFPSELLESCHDPESVLQMREMARDVPSQIKVAVALNLLTEEGLPHFHRLLGSYVGEDSVWQAWTNLWTAEEERHGAVLLGYCRATNFVHMPSLERLKFAYLRTGTLVNRTGNPYTVFAYTAIQERATQIAHARIGKSVRETQPLLGAIFARIAAEEARHFAFYRRVFAEILSIDPDYALAAVLEVMTRFTMPGRGIPEYTRLAEVVRVAGIFGPRDYLAIVQELLSDWNIADLGGLSEDGQRCQDALLRFPRKLTRFAEICESDRRIPDCNFDFLVAPTRANSLGRHLDEHHTAIVQGRNHG